MLHRSYFVASVYLVTSVLFGVETLASPGQPTLVPKSAAVTALHDTEVIFDSSLVVGTTITAYVKVSAAYSLKRHDPVANADVRLMLLTPEKLKKEAQKRFKHVLLSTTTDKSGRAIARFEMPELPSGEYRLAVDTRSRFGRRRVISTVSVIRHNHLLLRTDRGVYTSGQTVKWLVIAQNRVNAKPISAPIKVQIKDPRGTLIWRGKKKLGPGGMVSGSLPLGEDLLFGQYQIQVSGLESNASQTFSVRDYRLPDFHVRIDSLTKTPLAQGTTFMARIRAHYFNGEPVSGTVQVMVEGNRLKKARLNKSGYFDINARVPTDVSSMNVGAVIIDDADRQAQNATDFAIRPDALSLAIVEEGIGPNDQQRVLVITTDDAGTLAPATIHLRIPGQAKRISRRSLGAIRFSFSLPKNSRGATLKASAVDDEGRVASGSIYAYPQADQRRLEVDRVLVEAGEPIKLAGSWPSDDKTIPKVATLLREGVPVATAYVRRDRKGKLNAYLNPPEGVFGLATVRLLAASQEQKDVSRTLESTVYLLPTPLKVSIDAKKRHAPGKKVRLAINVRDRHNKPAKNVRLAASVVDERALALSAPKPDLVTVLKDLDLKHAYAAGLHFHSLAGRKDKSAKLAMAALIHALPANSGQPFVKITAAERYSAELERLKLAKKAVYRTLLVDPKPIGKRVGKGWDFLNALDHTLTRAGWKQDKIINPWGRRTTWDYARQALSDWTFENVAPSIARQRLEILASSLRKNRPASRKILSRHRDLGLRKLIASGKIKRYLGVDPWGTPIGVDVRKEGKVASEIDFISAGPDQRFFTPDDIVVVDALSRLGAPRRFRYYWNGLRRGGLWQRRWCWSRCYQ